MVDFLRVFEAGKNDLTVEGPEETAEVAFMTGTAGLFYEVEQAVRVAVHADTADLLQMTGLFAFFPEFLPGPAVVVGVACFFGEFDRFGVGVGEHENGFRCGVLYDYRDKAVVVGERVG